jgi:hypothetical protein
MDPELKNKLDNIQSLAEDNNKMLKKIRRGQRWTSFLQAIYWLIIISLGIGAFYFLEPYIDQMRGFINNTGDTINSIKNIMPR